MKFKSLIDRYEGEKNAYERLRYYGIMVAQVDENLHAYLRLLYLQLLLILSPRAHPALSVFVSRDGHDLHRHALVLAEDQPKLPW